MAGNECVTSAQSALPQFALIDKTEQHPVVHVVWEKNFGQ
jgi:hypothetical protein